MSRAHTPDEATTAVLGVNGETGTAACAADHSTPTASLDPVVGRQNPVGSESAESTEALDAPPQQRPRVRVFAVLWGAVLVAFAVGAFLLTIDPVRQTLFAERVFSLDLTTVVAIGFTVVGGVIVLGAVAKFLSGLGERDTRTE